MAYSQHRSNCSTDILLTPVASSVDIVLKNLLFSISIQVTEVRWSIKIEHDMTSAWPWNSRTTTHCWFTSPASIWLDFLSPASVRDPQNSKRQFLHWHLVSLRVQTCFNRQCNIHQIQDCVVATWNSFNDQLYEFFNLGWSRLVWRLLDALACSSGLINDAKTSPQRAWHAPRQRSKWFEAYLEPSGMQRSLYNK